MFPYEPTRSYDTEMRVQKVETTHNTKVNNMIKMKIPISETQTPSKNSKTRSFLLDTTTSLPYSRNW